MEHAKKMFLVEPKLLEGIQQQHVVQNPTIKSMSKLDEEMHATLQRDDLSTEDKVKAYDQILQRFLVYDDKYRNRPPVKVQVVKNKDSKLDESVKTDATVGTDPMESKKDPIEEDILLSVPTSMRGKAERLLNKIKTKSDMGWNDRGELIFKGKVIEDTNVVDLVNDVLRRRKHFEPRGWQVFSTGLRESNVPQDLIGHKQRWQWMQTGDTSDRESDEEDVLRKTSVKKVPKDVKSPMMSYSMDSNEPFLTPKAAPKSWVPY